MIQRSIVLRNIPDEMIFQIISKDILKNARPHFNSEHMRILKDIWYRYVEPHEQPVEGCGICLRRIFQCFRTVKIEMEKISKDYLLNQI